MCRIKKYLCTAATANIGAYFLKKTAHSVNIKNTEEKL